MKMGRLGEISKVFLEEGLALSSTDEKPNGPPPKHLPQSDKEKAERLRRALFRLGPTFVKFGQLLSSRIDLFSEEFQKELGKLRSHVPPFPTPEARAILEAELERPVEELFAEFPDEPIASASMAQVYRARLRSSGQPVAIKLTRPGLRETLERDLELIIDISKTLDHLLPVYHRSMVHQVALEYASRSRQESDLLSEARAMREFAQVTESVPEFVVPEVYLEHCTEKVLVMQWFDGTLLDTVADKSALESLGFVARDFSRSLLRLQLVMSYEYGLVHGDTHAGNIVLLPHGKIGLIDFGLHGQVPRKLCDQMLELLFYQASGRTADAVSSFQRIFESTGHTNVMQFESELTEILETEPDTPQSNPLTSQLIAGLRLGAKYQLKAQSELFLVVRNLTIVEGLVLRYFPEQDVVKEAARILQDILTRRAFRGLASPELNQVVPLLLLNVAKRPELMQTLLRLERSLSDSTSLGDFLKSEGVYDYPLPQKNQPYWLFALTGVLAATITAVVLLLFL